MQISISELHLNHLENSLQKRQPLQYLKNQISIVHRVAQRFIRLLTGMYHKILYPHSYSSFLCTKVIVCLCHFPIDFCSFLSLLPEQLKSSYQTADSGYDMYLRDAHKQVKQIVLIYKCVLYRQTDLQKYELGVENFHFNPTCVSRNSTLLVAWFRNQRKLVFDKKL